MQFAQQKTNKSYKQRASYKPRQTSFEEPGKEMAQVKEYIDFKQTQQEPDCRNREMFPPIEFQ